MTDNYDIVFEIESGCEKEIRKSKIPLEKLDEYINKIINYSVMFYEKGTEVHISKVVSPIQSMLYFETTLYCVRLGASERALITIDEDEIFDKLIISLWAFTTNHDYKKIFRRLSESMYQRYINQGEDKV